MRAPEVPVHPNYTALTSQWPDAALAQMEQLETPAAIQTWLSQFAVDEQSWLRSPLTVMRDRRASVLDGALWAAAALRRLGHPPLLVWAAESELFAAAVFRDERGWAWIAHHTDSQFRLGDLGLADLAALTDAMSSRLGGGEVATTAIDLADWDARDWMTDDQQLVGLLAELDDRLSAE
jgi:hypothetical protein